MTTSTISHGRALIVIDVQNDYDGGNLAIEFPPFDKTVANIATAMDAAEKAGVKIVVVRQMAPASSPIFAEGSHGGELHPLVAGRARDHYVEKKLPSAFAGTDLEEWLQANGINKLVITGYMTSHCCLSTTLHAAHHGYEVEYLSDATGAAPFANRAGAASAEEVHRVLTVILQTRFAAVMSTAEWIAALGGAECVERDSLYGSNQRAIGVKAA